MTGIPFDPPKARSKADNGQTKDKGRGKENGKENGKGKGIGSESAESVMITPRAEDYSAWYIDIDFYSRSSDPSSRKQLIYLSKFFTWRSTITLYPTIRYNDIIIASEMADQSPVRG